MAIWPFNRNKNENSDLPQEVQDYYQSEQRQRRGVAGLLAIGTLVATVVLALGIFFGGRWLYRTIFDNGKDQTANNNTSQTEQPAANNNDQPSSPTPSTDNTNQNQTNNQPQTSTPSTSTESTKSGTEQTALNKSGQNIPNTGPGDVVAVFIGTVLVASVAHYALSRRKLV